MVGAILRHCTTVNALLLFPPPPSYPVHCCCTRAWYTRAEVLRQRQETLLAQKADAKEVENDQEMNDSGSGVDSDFEYDDLLDWRRKHT